MNHSTHYDYKALDKLLTIDSDPVELGNQLDEIMEVLTAHATQDDSYHPKLEDHYYVLRVMRNIFWKLLPSREAVAFSPLKLQRSNDE